jgi:hypothetical protein
MIKRLKDIKLSKAEKEKALITLAIDLCPQKKWKIRQQESQTNHKGIDPINLKNKIFLNSYDIYKFFILW